jgi:hypothetical protein
MVACSKGLRMRIDEENKKKRRRKSDDEYCR